MALEPPFIACFPEAASFHLPRRTPAPPTDDPRALPIPPPYLLLGHRDGEQFLDWGEQHAGHLRRILEAGGFAFRDGSEVLDFGCGSGRMTRFLVDVADRCRVWGVDIRAEHIVWCQQHLSPPFRFLTTTVYPHLPFEQRSFDLVYAGSVFTHIEALADAWLQEMHRILRPGGFFYVTIHDEHTLEMLRGILRDHDLARLCFADDLFCRVTEEGDWGMISVGRGEASQVFYRRDHFAAMVAERFEVVSATEEAYGYQTALLLRRPS